MALKNYEDGMTRGGDGLGENSKFVLGNSTGSDTLSGDTATGKFVPVSLSDTSPSNQTVSNPAEGDPNE